MVIVQSRFLEDGGYNCFFKNRMKLARAERERLTMLMIVGIRTEAQDLTSQVGIGSESHCLLGQLKRIYEISDSEAGIKVVKSA